VDHPKNAPESSDIPVGTSPYKDGIFPQEKGILRALVYADIFGYPLTEEEIFNYSIAYPVTCDEVRSWLCRSSWLENRLEKKGTFWFLKGRSHLVERRKQRNEISRLLWIRAQQYVLWLAALPFVKMVAITGSMAMKNIASVDDDIDVMIVAENQRVFLVRSLAAVISRLARLSGVHLCPNFIISEGSLRISDESLFTAHELVQLIPVFGKKTYLRLWKSNRWIGLYLPNASPRLQFLHEDNSPPALYRRIIEVILGGKTGQTLNRWEHRRKLARIKPYLWESSGSGAFFSTDIFKAHFSDHQEGVLRQYTARLRELGIDDPDGCHSLLLLGSDGTRPRAPRKSPDSKGRLYGEHL
jgi:hypothetical protein